MNEQTIRITTSEPDEVLEAFLQKYSTTYLYVCENEESNRHYHVYMETDQKVDTLRKALAKTFGAGNKTFSLTKCKDTVKYMAYICKTGDPQGHLLHYSESLSEAGKYDTKVKKDLKAKREKGPVWQKIMTEMSEQEDPDWSPAGVTRYVIHYTKRESTLVREFFMISIVQTILLQKNEDYSIQLESSIMDRITKIHM